MFNFVYCRFMFVKKECFHLFGKVAVERVQCFGKVSAKVEKSVVSRTFASLVVEECRYSFS
jgi:hypothetical protein